jgi:UDP-N-acetylmuramate dehydrogenase
MMVAPSPAPRLIERLPSVRGRLVENAPLDHLTWFRVGGPAEILFRPADAEDLAAFLAAKPADVPVTVIGVASNLLIRDGGIDGVVIRLGRGFADIAVSDDTVSAGAAALDTTVARVAEQHGLGGLEFLSGIPGTIGGAFRTNAGAYGADLKSVLVSATALDGQGTRIDLPASALGLDYRSSQIPADWIFTDATLQALPTPPDEIAVRMAAIEQKRRSTQPVRARTGGSTFANPQGARAWELIDQAGCRGLVRGGAMVSELHANFLLNRGGATAADLEGLGEEVRRRVFETSGVTLEWEIKRIGRTLPCLGEVTP